MTFMLDPAKPIPKTVRKAAEKQLRKASAEPGQSAEAFHEWRKQVKYLRHQFGLLRQVWPDVLDTMEGTADDLGDGPARTPVEGRRLTGRNVALSGIPDSR
jgi:CHAD domain